MALNHSASRWMKSLLIICSKSAKVTSKQCSAAISIGLFFRIKLSKVIHWLFHLFTKRCSHANWKSTDKWSPTCFKSIQKISHLSFWLSINKTLRLNKLKTRTAMDEKTRVFAICFEVIIYLLLNSLLTWLYL